MRTILSLVSPTIGAARSTGGAMFALALLLSGCRAQGGPSSPSGRAPQMVAARASRPPASPMAAAVKLAALIGERGPSEEALKKGAPFVKVWNDYTANKQDRAVVRAGRDHLQVSMPDGSMLLCRFRDTPSLQVKETGGFARDYHLSLTVACDNGRTYERFWDCAPSINGANVMSTLRPVAAQIADLWNQLAIVPPAATAFLDEAAKYREAATKPELPESAREFKVRAENAVAEKRLFDAVEAFDRALQIAPWWPQGHYNVALILGELNAYALATDEMQSYLMLAPDAANARTAQDKIYAWRGKLESNTP